MSMDGIRMSSIEQDLTNVCDVS